MCGIGSAEVTAEAFDTPDAMPCEARTLLSDADDLFSSRTWWDVVLAQALPPEARPVFLVCRAAGRVLLVMPLVRNGKGSSLASLTTPYTCLYTPLFAAGLDESARVGAMRALARFCRPAGVTRLDALPAGWDGWGALGAAARREGLRLLRFDHFGNWHEDVAGLGWSGYLAKRPGALRETIRRRLRRAEALPEAVFRLLSSPYELDAATAAFEDVYARSWKEPEPFPHFNTAFMRAMATEGLLRLGLWSVGDAAVATQLWVASGGRATVLKLAHDEAFKAHSPGTVLTALMLRHLLDTEGVGEIDFGRGDDDYKKGWATERRQRVGVLMVNPLHHRGALELLRHGAGQIRMRLRGRLAGPSSRH
jgi:CelD/BcsL family acetyltransferase involved in cellulose biosynthesis